MCGLIGIAGDITYKTMKAFDNLLKVGSLRGEHSAGVGVIHDDNTYTLVKDIGTGFDLANNPLYTSAIKNIHDIQCIIGHNRAATIGRINKFNAHPFVSGMILGAHNGTLKNKGSLTDNSKFETDSETIINHININKNPIKTLELLRGAYALTWFDFNEQTINFARNYERDLYFCYIEKTTIMWCSEKDMLEFVLLRNSVEYDDILLLKVGKIFSANIDDKGIIEKEVKTFTPAKDVAYSSMYDHNKGLNTKPINRKVLPFNRPATKAPNTKHMSKKAFNAHTRGGTCAWCDATILFKDRNKILFLIEEGALCTSCCADKAIVEDEMFKAMIMKR